MDAIRKQLDALMGANRNGDVAEVNRKYYDRDVCRLFLAGVCPHDLFQLTKMDMGPCPKVHSLQLRKEYEEAKAKGIHNFDRELEDMIERLIGECERKIQRALKRLEEEDAKAAIAISVSEVTQTPEIMELSKQIKEKHKEADTFDLEGKTDGKIRALEEVEELRNKRADKQAMLLLEAFNKDRATIVNPLQNPPQLASLPALPPPDPRTQEMINEKLKKAEELGEKGMIDEAQKALEEAEALKKLGARQEPVSDGTKFTAADVRITDQKLRLCDICGAFLSVYDSRLLGPVLRGLLLQLKNSFRKREISGGKGTEMNMTEGPKNEEVWTVTGQEAETEIETAEVAVTRGAGIMIVGAEITTAITIETVDMIRNGIELPVMNLGVDEGHVLVLVHRNDPEITVGTGDMIDTEDQAEEYAKSILHVGTVLLQENL
uniref:RNA-binding protein Luc7-like 2 n=1 Tax=Ananas comosus var. bracteatus TaxID=296719 RepID=A0A6V7Q1W2_ANACO|nr:unnamed protein product [Ananas comosus var. bracteatus]